MRPNLKAAIHVAAFSCIHQRIYAKAVGGSQRLDGIPPPDTLLYDGEGTFISW